MFPDVGLPADLKLASAEPNPLCETNSVFFCRGWHRQSPVEGYLKIADRTTRSLENERSVLERLALSDIPVPTVVASGGDPTPFLFLTAAPGTMLWDFIDPRRPGYDKSTVLPNLRAYGELLARIHALDVNWADQPRARLEGLIGEERVLDRRFQDLVEWINQNHPSHSKGNFIHGDFNTANVLLDRGAVSGVLDWEFAGMGWKEYELAWALRARIHFLNSTAERDTILTGYQSGGSYDAKQLRWCEVLNYLHFAYWETDSNSGYTAFALARAESAATA